MTETYSGKAYIMYLRTVKYTALPFNACIFFCLKFLWPLNAVKPLQATSCACKE